MRFWSLALLFLPSLATAVPLTLPQQGRLYDGAGAPLTGVNEVTFTLYDDPASGTSLWTETHAAAFADGVYSVNLGSITPLSHDLFAGDSRWLGVQVGSNPELTPRIKVGSVPFALRAGAVEGAVNADQVSVNGQVVINADGQIDWARIAGAPADADTLAGLSCASGEVAAWSGSAWACAPAGVRVHAHCASDITSGTLDIARIPVGADPGTVAAGDHLHGFGQITGQAALSQLPVGTSAAEVAAGNHTHDAAAIVSGTLAADRLPTTGYSDLSLSGDLSATDGEFSGTIRVGGASAGCTSANTGAIRYAAGAFEGCTPAGWVPLALQQNDGSSENFAASNCKEINALPGGRGNGLYWLDPDGTGTGAAPFLAWCDNTVASGGWTLALNLDTSDGHVMWWANPLWRNNSAHGTVETPFEGDHKSPAFASLTGTTDLLIVVHEQGIVRGWRAFRKTNTNTLASYLAAGDNTLISNSVLASDVGGLWANEKLVRSSTDLYANRCVYGACVSYGGGSPDGNRIGSTASQNANNSGGGLGVWHDMGHCCSGQNYGGVACNGSAFRSTSEAQAGWYAPGYEQVGSFGSDTAGPWTGAATDSPCGNSAWTRASGQNYDYAIYLR